MNHIALLTAFLVLFLLDSPTAAQATKAPVTVEIYYSDDCNHCNEARRVLEQLARQDSTIHVLEFEVWNDEKNLARLVAKAAVFGYTPDALPNIFVGSKYWVGYSATVDREVRAALGAEPVRDQTQPPPVSAPASGGPVADLESKSSPSDQGVVLNFPIIGAIDLRGQSLLIATLIIGFVDGINPCSLWVLSMLLTLTLHTGSRLRVFLIGALFILATSIVYAAFITGMFALTTLVTLNGWMSGLVIATAGVFGLVNIKDYFWYKKGPSLSIPDKSKPKIFERIRGLMVQDVSLWALIIGTVVLAVGVSFVELGCTAGLPMLWTQLLTESHVDPATYAWLLFAYMLVYQVIPMVLFVAAVWSLRASRIGERHGRMLKLITGVMMLLLAAGILGQLLSHGGV
ncbi:MAG: hypothetical protein WCG80_02635 [Spirochaetales bacterium]